MPDQREPDLCPYCGNYRNVGGYCPSGTGCPGSGGPAPLGYGVCPDCKGTGGYAPGEHENAHEFFPPWIPCQRCHGTGNA